MAGSPGAGKTEFSKNIIDILENNNNRSVVRIDGDEIRSLIPGYTGNNSYLFQGAISLIVEKIHDLVLQQKQSFVLDGTCSKYDKAISNITRSLSNGRRVFIFFVYQNPETAWKFTQKREKLEGRHIPKEIFIEQFLSSKETIDRIRKEFDEKVTVFLVKKNFENNTVEKIVEIKVGSPLIDEYTKDEYTKQRLEDILL